MKTGEGQDPCRDSCGLPECVVGQGCSTSSLPSTTTLARRDAGWMRHCYGISGLSVGVRWCPFQDPQDKAWTLTLRYTYGYQQTEFGLINLRGQINGRSASKTNSSAN